jgi:hypothetical protein
VSPREQAERIQSVATRGALELTDTIEEPNVSGGAPLEKGPCLSRAVPPVEIL